MDMAMNYEGLMRSAYQVGKGKAPGADADIYRKMDRASYQLEIENAFIKNNKNRSSSLSIEELEYNLRVETLLISGYIHRAIKNALTSYGHKFNIEQISELNKTFEILKNNLSVQIVEKAIKNINEILYDVKLTPQ